MVLLDQEQNQVNEMVLEIAFSVKIFVFLLQLSCAEPTTSCPLDYFQTSLGSLSAVLPSTVTESTFLCQHCHFLCASCDGPSMYDCLTCTYAFFTNSSTARVSCLQSCDETTAVNCITCHEQCIGCTGPTEQECVTCREDSVAIGTLGQQVCVPECKGNTYLSQDRGDYTCRQCHSQCVGCKGSRDTDCIACRCANITVNSTSTCVANCPTGYYNESGSCLVCHEYCVECTGPSARNCTECVDDEVEVEDGESECVPSCSYGREYDRAEVMCVLTRYNKYL